MIDRHFGASLVLGPSRFLIIFGMFIKIGWKWTGDSIFFRPLKPILSHFKIRKNWKMIYLGILNQFSLELKSPLGEKRRTETLCKSTITKLCISTAWHYPKKLWDDKLEFHEWQDILQIDLHYNSVILPHHYSNAMKNWGDRISLPTNKIILWQLAWSRIYFLKSKIP